MISVFYDGKCGLCRREISHYRRIAPKNIFKWIDITIQPEQLQQLGVTLEEGLASLHVQSNDKKIYQGVDSFLLIWDHIPRFCWLSRILRIKLFYVSAVFVYAKFAEWHFAHMGYKKCNI